MWSLPQILIDAAPGAENLNVLGNGSTIFYTTDRGVFERTSGTTATRVAGGGNITPTNWTNGKPAIQFGDSPNGLIAMSPSDFDFTTPDNLLAIVRDGRLWEYRTNSLDFFNGEMSNGPGEKAYAICGWWMCRIEGLRYMQLFRIPTNSQPERPQAELFLAPIGLAAAPHGNFYVSFINQTSPSIGGIYEMGPSGTLLRILVVRKS